MKTFRYQNIYTFPWCREIYALQGSVCAHVAMPSNKNVNMASMDLRCTSY